MTRKFVGGSYDINARKADVQRAVNLFPVVAEVAGAKAVAYLDSIPGLGVFSADVAAQGPFLLLQGGGFLLLSTGGKIRLEPT